MALDVVYEYRNHAQHKTQRCIVEVGVACHQPCYMQTVAKNNHCKRHEHDVKHILYGHDFASDLAWLGGEVVALHVCILLIPNYDTD